MVKQGRITIEPPNMKRMRRPDKDPIASASFPQAAEPANNTSQTGMIANSPTLSGLKLLQRNVLLKITDLLPNQVRARGADPRQVQRFAEMIRNYEPFPNIIVIQTPDGRNHLSDGHQRCLGAKQVGEDNITADLYSGNESDIVNVALETNRVGSSLKPQDVINAAVMQEKMGCKSNISDLARRAGVCRATARKYFRERQEEKAAGWADSGKKSKTVKTPAEIAAGLADKVVDLVEDGMPEAVIMIFEKLSGDLRADLFAMLRERFGDSIGA